MITAGGTGDAATIDRVRGALREQGSSVTLVVPSYREGSGIVATLDSLWEGMGTLGIEEATIFLSDSSPDSTTVDAARAWSSVSGCHLVVDHSDERRSLKEALNVALAACETDLVAVTNADVLVPRASLAHLLEPICATGLADVVVGVAAPDPSATSLARRAGAFQLRAVQRLVDRTGTAMPAEGALWAAHRRFCASFRFPIGQGSVADDVELAKGVEAGRLRGITAPGAVVLTIPPGTVRDFCLQTRRSYFATGESRPAARCGAELRAFVAEASRDPLGAVLYGLYRGVAAVTARRWVASAHAELWEPSASTKRDPTG